MRTKLTVLLATVCAVFLLFQAAPAQAADKYWIGGTGSWDEGTNWNPLGQPQLSDYVYITQSDAADRTITYQNTTNPNDRLTLLCIDATGTGAITLLQNTDTLSSSTGYIGYSGTGTFTQTGGMNMLRSELYLGYYLGSTGNYNLSGTGSLTTGAQLTVGYNGTGNFKQTGGTNTPNALFLGYDSGSTGIYELNNTGSLSTANEYIGFFNGSNGTFKQTGGVNTVTENLYIGLYSGSNGIYELSGDTSSISVSSLYIGNQGTGAFKQTGGVNNVYGDLYLGLHGGSGAYELSGTGQLLVSGLEYVGFNSPVAFTQTGGTNVANALLIGEFGTYELSGTGSLQVSSLNVSNIFKQGGQTSAQIRNDLNIESYIQGSYELSNTASLSAFDEYIGKYSGTGTFRQTGGTHTVSNNLYLGYYNGGDFRGTGIYELSGGNLTIVPEYNNSAGNLYVGYSGTGTFRHSAGDNTIGNTLYLGYNTGGIGSYELSGAATLSSVNQYIGRDGIGRFIQTGGTNTVTNTLRITSGYEENGNSSYELSGTSLLLTANSAISKGTFQQTGGIHRATNALWVAPLGSYSLSGGNLETRTLYLSGTFTYSGGNFTGAIENNGGAFLINGPGLRTITGSVNNLPSYSGATSTFRVSNTSVTYTDVFSNNGAYLSEQSVSTFSDLYISEGYLRGGAADQFLIGRNFYHVPAPGSDLPYWDTRLSLLGFITGSSNDHQLYLPGTDMGPNLLGYENNFAWGTLSIGNNNHLYLYDALTYYPGFEADGGAFYARLIIGALISGDTITNIHGQNGLNIYYLASAQGNAYLGGLTYNFTDGGQLIPVGNVPLPPAVWLLGAGLLGLIGIRKRLKT
jgi:T5SS/PEP-CTERM-associated repeat protein